MYRKLLINFRIKGINIVLISIFAFTLLNVIEISSATAQSSSASTQQKKADKKKADHKKSVAKAEAKGVERQRKIQTKETQKRMKKHRKQTTTPYKKPNFFQRLFGRKH